MEDHLDAEVVGVCEDVLIELHHLLLVATEEVYLDAQDAVLLHPRHLLTTGTRLVHLPARTLRSVVPRTVGVIPQEQSHAFLLAIPCQFLHLLVADLRVPEGIHEHRAVAHGGREVYIALLLVEVTTGVHADDPRPRALAVGVVLRGLVLRLHQVGGNGGLHDGCQGGANGDRAPRRLGRQRHQRRSGTRAVHLLCQRETDTVVIVLIIHQTTANVTSICARL